MMTLVSRRRKGCVLSIQVSSESTDAGGESGVGQIDLASQGNPVLVPMR